ncbi:MAG: pyridoxamine 5'-phosphate oxidase family protein [Actinobacteria bacterium]|nr:pyridoxamine 5'-phosphate oxidase family protein [Actinomycetota bacterium]MBW3642662.1 pyridoxamine 5'-phosphate oxidase family protein [Actinomycetota bacterium]
MSEAVPFDVDTYLSQPLVARVAAVGSSGGPTIRPVWYLWEDGAFWWLTGPWSGLEGRLREDGNVALVIDSCDLVTGCTRQVRATGRAEIVAADVPRVRRTLARYLGGDEQRWEPRFRHYLEDPAVRLVRLVPERLAATDLSFRPSR